MASTWQYYESVKRLANEKRSQYGVNSPEINLRFIRGIYRQENISIKYANPGQLRKLKAAYFNDEDGIDVLLNPQLPKEVRIFALIHELKHHYLDANGHDVLCLKAYDDEPVIEKSAEVFAAEFIWPETIFKQNAQDFGINKENCTPEILVRFKKAMGVPASYTFIKKRLEWFKIIDKGEYDSVKFQKLEYGIYGKPFYLK